ncbi:hypothetical protein GW17_00023552 [Ensete ventricosum]|nr:hypothetical protein GW17_00023552 [Ensete ventricosum]
MAKLTLCVRTMCGRKEQKASFGVLFLLLLLVLLIRGRREQRGRIAVGAAVSPGNRRSPSPPSSASSTLSSSLVGGGGGGEPSSSDGSATAIPSAAAAAALEEICREEGAAELPPTPPNLAAGGVCNFGGVDVCEALLSEPAASIGQDQIFLRWNVVEVDDNPAAGINATGLPLGGLFDPAFALEGASVPAEAINPPPLVSSLNSAGRFESKGPAVDCGNTDLNPSLPPPPGSLFQEPMEERPFPFSMNKLLAQQQQTQPPNYPSFFLPLHPSAGNREDHQPQHFFSPLQKRPAVVDSFPDSRTPGLFLLGDQPQQLGFRQHLNASGFQLQQTPAKPKLADGNESVAAAAAMHQALVDQLSKAAELIEAGNIVSARGILARLNHQLPFPVGKPLLRSAFYFKEALHLLAAKSHRSPPPSSSHISTPLDVVLKLGTYKAFSDVSPIVQFTSFTCIQALLEALGSATRIYIIDLDIGVGVQWSAFMQELAQRCWSMAMTAVPYLKITAFTSPSSHHPLELHLIHQNLCHFASSLSIPFEFDVLNLNDFDPSILLRICSGLDAAVAVNLRVGSATCPPISTLLRFVTQLCPKIVVTVDHGCDRVDLPFAHHVLHALQSCTVLLDSIDAAGANRDVVNKIERYLVQPRIENAVLGRRGLSDKKTLPWRTLFASAGFVPMRFSNFTETQAECLLKKVLLARGFHVEKCPASLSLCWQRRELVSVSAWKC